MHLCVPVALGEASAHHVGDSEGLHSQQVEDHGVSQSELGVQKRRLPLRKTPKSFDEPHDKHKVRLQMGQIQVWLHITMNKTVLKINSNPSSVSRLFTYLFFKQCENYVK